MPIVAIKDLGQVSFLRNFDVLTEVRANSKATINQNCSSDQTVPDIILLVILVYKIEGPLDEKWLRKIESSEFQGQ